MPLKRHLFLSQRVKECNLKVFLLDVVPVLQNGPTCGLICLLMAASYYSTPIPPLPDLLKQAQDLHLSISGELFSAQNLHSLASLYFDSQCVEWNTAVLEKHLYSGGLVLVAYDSDGNHEPCNKLGQAAHWAVVHGIATPISDIDFKETQETLQWILASHGKSCYTSLWNYSDLQKSNQQLSHVKEGLDPLLYRIPPGGDLQGLRGYMVLLRSKSLVESL